MRIDAHQHFWTYDAEEYGWIGDGMEALRRDFHPADLARALRERKIDGSVAVQARQSEAETRMLCDLARGHEHVLGVVGWVDLQASDVGERLAELAKDPALVGLRHVIQDEPDDRFAMRPEFQRGVAALAHAPTAHGRPLVYDVLIYPRQMEAALGLVDAFPEQPFVLDHLAKPFIKDRRLDPWRAELRALAERPHLACKVSGLVTEADWKAWKPADLVPYLDAALDAFGPGRLLFGSDWPVCLLAASYAQVVDAVADWASDRLGEAERAALFGENARRIYGV